MITKQVVYLDTIMKNILNLKVLTSTVNENEWHQVVPIETTETRVSAHNATLPNCPRWCVVKMGLTHFVRPASQRSPHRPPLLGVDRIAARPYITVLGYVIVTLTTVTGPHARMPSVVS